MYGISRESEKSHPIWITEILQYRSKAMSHWIPCRILTLNSSFTQAFKLGSRKPLHNWFTTKTVMKLFKINCNKAFYLCIYILNIECTCVALNRACIMLDFAQHRTHLSCTHLSCNHMTYCLFKLVSCAKQENLLWSNALLIHCELMYSSKSISCVLSSIK